MSKSMNHFGSLTLLCIVVGLGCSGCMDMVKAIPQGLPGITHDTATQTEAEKESGVPAPLWQTFADVLAYLGLGGAAIYIKSVKKVANGQNQELKQRIERLELERMKETTLTTDGVAPQG